MAKTPDQMKKEYEKRHAISHTDQLGEVSTIDGNGGLADKGAYRLDRESDGLIRGTTSQQSGTIIDAGSARKFDRGEREYGREDEPSGGSSYQDTQRYGSVDRRTESQEQVVDLPQDRIINVATTPEKKKRGRPTGATSSSKKEPEIRAAVVDVLRGNEVETTRKRLRAAYIGMFKAFDDGINLTLRDKPPQPLIIWSGIDDADIDTLVEARISHAQHSVIEARVVKAVISVYEQFASGLITLPRLYQTYLAYHLYGFELPGASMMPRRRRRNLRVVNNEQSETSETGTTT
jgi:hypothetical protein